MDPRVLLVMTTVPDLATGERLARLLVEARLAACVNIIAGVTSIYRWQGAVEQASEHQLLIKTSASSLLIWLHIIVKNLNPWNLCPALRQLLGTTIFHSAIILSKKNFYNTYRT